MLNVRNRLFNSNISVVVLVVFVAVVALLQSVVVVVSYFAFPAVPVGLGAV
jgi:hypothetical protein